MKTEVDRLMSEKLNIRKAENALRQLKVVSGLVDFSSNDYLGFAKSKLLNQEIKEAITLHEDGQIGSTGSRLLTGNSAYAEELEREIASHHQVANGLIFNSGYAANTALLSCLPAKGDTIIMDEYIHASMIDGARLSYAKRFKFKHNDLEDLEHKLRQKTGICYVAIESIYSMDGDMADLISIAHLCKTYGAHLIVDEAHAFGVTGTGVVDTIELQRLVFARIITFGKALGLHGAIILGSQLLKNYLVNFARPFVYSTAPPLNHLIAIKTAYNHLLSRPHLQKELKGKIKLFYEYMPAAPSLDSTRNPTPIQCVFFDGNDACRKASDQLVKQGFDVRAILSPTVPYGKERLRICLHLHNSDEEVISLCKKLSTLSNN